MRVTATLAAPRLHGPSVHVDPIPRSTNGFQPVAAVDAFPVDLSADEVPDLVEARPRWVARYRRYLVVCDLVVSSVAAATAWLVRFDGSSPGWRLTVVAFPLLWVMCLALCRSYEPRNLAEGSEEFRRVLESAVRLVAAFAIVSYALNEHISRGYAGMAFLLTVVGSLGVRALGRLQLLRLRRVGRASRRVLVVGGYVSSLDIAHGLLGSPERGYQVVGVLTDDEPGADVVPVVGRECDVQRAVTELRVDTIVVAPVSSFRPHDLRSFSWELECTHVDLLVSPNLSNVAGPRVQLRPVAGIPLLHVEKPEFGGLRRVAKSVFDRLVSMLALVVLAPLFAVVAVVIRLDSPGPAFFRQQRVGRAGQVFTLWKFRSMHIDAEHELDALIDRNEHEGAPLFKMRADPRITRFGRFLRRTSLDELPQLINVLLGNMSLVGPRPPLPSEVERYGEHVHRRLLVRPGLTGVWQVSGRSDLSWDESVRLDLHYVENWTLWFDLSILCRTVRAVTQARGAY